MVEISKDEENVELLDEMPTSRLNDILKSFSSKNLSVVNLDACIPPKEAGEPVLKTILYKIPKSVKILSLRFISFSQNSIENLVNWVASNEDLETLYLMGSGIDEKYRVRIEDSWKKNLFNHRTDNMGYTFIRVSEEAIKEYDSLQKSNS